MGSQNSILDELEAKTKKFVKSYYELKKEKSELESELAETQKKLSDSRAHVQELEDINQQMKIVNAMLGSSEHRRLMKLRINKLIREVDACIAEVKKQ